MLRRFLPKQENFFNDFQKMANLVVQTANEYHNMMRDLHNQENHVKNIQSFEAEGDHIAHDLFRLLHKTFITPFDRNDIHRFISSLDDVLDQLNSCAQRFPYYNLTAVPLEILKLSELTLKGSEFLRDAIACLNNLSNAEKIFVLCEKIDNIESEAHQLVLAGERTLFREENDFKYFYKLKEIYQRTKLVIDVLQDVGNMVKGIVLEYS